ncbi:3'(2'),5'-bisphosphate nucleotidase CysQ [Aquimixticola soesokkakensis]|uniref:3'(2'),5'-bisphosphate nucleotidase CysQ n=1 Tax=Aquimixticola soesokkakensis TaxID=1519096 RepID=UPI00278C891D|nr:3'(2'),5'-bisphosphate nucleotidase CysQ [Aquimixticola soesokkakensis]
MSETLQLLIDAARKAGALALPYWRADPQVWQKDDGAGPVTEADLAVDLFLKEFLTAARPDCGWLSEETEDSDARLTMREVFIVDPIDGTRSFIEGDGNWAHSIALARDGIVTHAVVYLPVRDRLYTAELGKGACLNGAPITIDPKVILFGATVLTASANLNPALWPGGVPTIERKFRPSLAYRLSLVAQARYQAMLTLRDTWEWDVAAGTLIVTEAGGTVVDRHGQIPRFNNPHPAISGIVAANEALTGQITDRLRA